MLADPTRQPPAVVDEWLVKQGPHCPDAVEAATGKRPPLPNRMADLYERSERVTRVENSLAHVEELIEDRIAT